ncbi:MAG: hypothetical protein HY799_01550 [Nitrosomonadales bacterium]|nr:hypothetical protein [Nitrosomonadales bacterium]
MRILSTGLVGTVVLAVSACNHAPAVAVPAAAPAASRHELANRQARVPNEYLVTLAPEVKESVLTELFGHFGIREIHALGGETYLLILTKDPGPGEMSDLIQNDARFQAVQPNLIYWANRSGKKAQ